MEDERFMQDIQREYLDFLDDEVRNERNNRKSTKPFNPCYFAGGPRNLLVQHPDYGRGEVPSIGR